MKKLLVILFAVLVIIGYGVSNNEVKAVSINFDYGNVSPRFQYLRDDSGTLIPFEFVIYDNFDMSSDVENLELRLEQITYDGSFIKTLQLFVTNYYVYDSSIVSLSSNNFIAGGDITELEYIYIGDINYLTLGNLYVNSVLISSTEWEADEEGDYIILNASVSVIGDTIYFDYRSEQSYKYKANLVYDWAGLQEISGEEVLFYRLRYDNMTIFTGAVMSTPIVNLTYGTYGVEYGDFISRDDGLVDFSDQTDFTSDLVNDDYWILHYRIDSGITFPDYRTFHITDISSNTLYASFTTNDILSLQMGSGDNFLDSFIIIPLSDSIGEGLITDNVNMDSRYIPFLKGYDVGSYFIAMVNQHTSNSLIDSASVVWNVVYDDNVPFELELLKDSIALDDLQRVIFIKNSETISSAYETTTAKDYALGVNYLEEINISNYTYAISYHLDESLLEDDCVNVIWTLEPSFIPYSLTASDYAIELSEQYCVIAETDISGHINNSLVYYALDDDVGVIIFSIFVLIFVNVLLILFTRETFIYAIVNMVVILVLSFMELVPMWIVIAIFLLGFLGIKMSMSGGRSYE